MSLGNQGKQIYVYENLHDSVSHQVMKLNVLKLLIILSTAFVKEEIKIFSKANNREVFLLIQCWDAKPRWTVCFLLQRRKMDGSCSISWEEGSAAWQLISHDEWEAACYSEHCICLPCGLCKNKSRLWGWLYLEEAMGWAPAHTHS